MKKSILQIQCGRIAAQFHKLNRRLQKLIKTGEFQQLSKQKKFKLLSRLDKLKSKLSRWETLAKGAVVAGTLMATLNTTQGQSLTNIGTEYKVNTETNSNQENVKVAMDSLGNYVVVWQSSMQDGDLTGIYAQRYNASGTPQGNEFLVNTFTTGPQMNPDVAMDKDGDFVVVWQCRDYFGDNDDDVFAKRYNASGVAQGSEFMINTGTNGDQIEPSVAMDSDGDFVVTWLEDDMYPTLYERRYNAAGTAMGSPNSVIFSYHSIDQVIVEMDKNGNYVVVWEGMNNVEYDNIYARRYDASGSALGAIFKVNTYTTGNQENPALAFDASGNFVISWTNADNYNIEAQRYNSSGSATGSAITVNTLTGTKNSTSVAMSPHGDFIVAWANYGQDGDNMGVYARRFDNAGVAQGNDFLVNTYTTSLQTYPSITSSYNGNFTIAWSSFNQLGAGYEVYAQNMKLLYTPTDILLSSSAIDENVGANANVGRFSSVDNNLADTFTYSLVAGTGDTDNSAFAISGDTLKIVSSPNYEVKSSYSIRIRTTDANSQSFEKTFTITINDLTETSVLKADDGSAVRLHPNPTKDVVFINIENAQIRILDLSGKTLLVTRSINQTFRLEGLNPGMYLVEIEKDGAKALSRIVLE